MFEGVTEGGGITGGFIGIGKTIFYGGGIGIIGAGMIYELLRRFWIPDHLHSPTALAITLGAYWAANSVQHEAGLLSVTLMGVLLANQKRVDVRHILEFKENLRVLILSALFVLLAARGLESQTYEQIDFRAFAYLIVLIVIVRPLSTLAVHVAIQALRSRTKRFSRCSRHAASSHSRSPRSSPFASPTSIPKPPCSCP